MDRSDALDWFRYKEPTHEESMRCIRVRTAFINAVETYLASSEPGAEQVQVLRKAKETLMAMIGHVVSPLPADVDA